MLGGKVLTSRAGWDNPLFLPLDLASSGDTRSWKSVYFLNRKHEVQQPKQSPKSKLLSLKSQFIIVARGRFSVAYVYNNLSLSSPSSHLKSRLPYFIFTLLTHLCGWCSDIAFLEGRGCGIEGVVGCFFPADSSMEREIELLMTADRWITDDCGSAHKTSPIIDQTLKPALYGLLIPAIWMVQWYSSSGGGFM